MPDSNDRAFPRVAVVTEVEYRSTGSFLVSYSLNLSRGGIFLETEEMLPVGTAVPVRFSIPGALGKVETVATVIWRREPKNEEQLPSGLGLQFEGLERRIGAQIDALIRDFGGVVMLACANDTPSLERLEHYLASILTCKVVQQTAREIAEVGFLEQPDLILVDLDSTRSDGIGVIDDNRRAPEPVPIVGMTRNPRRQQLAKNAGITALLTNPPVFRELRQVVLEVLAKPKASQPER